MNPNQDALLGVESDDGMDRYLKDFRSSQRPSALAADFDMPVFAASMNVRIAAGRTVRLVALDSAGNVLSEVTSPAAISSSEFFPMQIASDTAIASIEWYGSAPNAELHMDDLFMTVPEPGAMVILVALVSRLLRRRSAACL